ncbi:MAG: T9SS type A sorting domain-containing protein [Saprospiraceae bacterium]|nr:T9SS type A sorting domain-containing protein [Saprospiraceae bacterium]
MRNVIITNTKNMNPIHSALTQLGQAVLLTLLVTFFATQGLNAQVLTARIATDTSVCKGANMVIYDVNTAGPWTFTLSGGGTIVTTTSTSVFINWGSVQGTYTITATSGIIILTRTVTVESSSTIACDDLINLSLDANCSAEITAAVVLEGVSYPEDSYTILTTDNNNNVVVDNIVNHDHLGQKLKVSITHLCSGIRCWGYVFVEDKFIPELDCNFDIPDQDCDADIRPEAVGFPIPRHASVFPIVGRAGCYTVKNFDLCCDVELCYYDVYEKNGCNVFPYASIERFWTAKDCKGNSTNCSEKINILQGDIERLRCPLNYDGTDNPPLECDSIKYPFGPYPAGWNSLENGHPSPYDYVNEHGKIIWKGTGVPVGVNCDHFAITYKDLKIPICGSSFKIFRSWKIYDWCTGRITDCNQLIKVADHKPPVIACRGNFMVFPTDYYTCTGTAIVSGPEFIDDCSTHTLSVSYKKADPNGNPESGDFRTTGVTTLPSGKVSISGLLQDTSWVRYTVTDACGNSTHCTVEVIIEDNLKPVAVCDESTVVTLGDSGVAIVFAASFDQGSFDNCMIDSIQVRRMTDNCGVVGNTLFGPSVTFCCADVPNNPIQVVLRVKDKKGNSNECMILVTVQDKIAPTISCPPNRTLNCTANIYDLNVTGRPVVSDNCGSPTVTYKDDSTGFKCFTGTITRRWKVEDAGGRFNLCNQTLTIIDNSPLLKSQITFPRDIEVPGCILSDGDPDITGKPTWPAKPCASIIAGYDDEKFYNVENVCIKIIRHWKVIDWCTYEVNNPSTSGLFTGEQIIKIKNTGKPQLLAPTCDTETILSTSSDCSSLVNLVGRASDDCTDSADLKWEFAVDLDNNGSIEVTGKTKNASGNFRAGTHRVRWTVTDACGNSTTCNKMFTVRDGKAPTPFCKPGLITVVMATNGTVTVKAKDYNEKSEDNCTPGSELKFSFSANVNDSTRTFSCADIPNGISRDTTIRVYVTDKFGNQEFCTTKLTLQDNNGNACPNRVGGTIAGLVSANTIEPLKNADIQIMHSQNLLMSMNTPDAGLYSFYDLAEGNDYLVKPIKNDDPLNGLSTADIVVIQKHILGKELFNSPYKYIAADLNNSKSITSADISELRKLILGVKTTMPGTQKSWRFVAMPGAFEDVNNPWLGGWREEINISNLTGVSQANDFYAVKIGDLNSSAKTNLLIATKSRTAGTISLEVDNQEFNTAEKVNVPVYGSWNEGILGFQIAWKVDPSKIEIVDFIPGVLDINQSNFNLQTNIPGIVNLSFSSEKPLLATREPLFYVTVKARYGSFNSAKVFTTSSEFMTSEAYNATLEVMQIDLRSRDSKKSMNAFELFQNTPNPFNDQTIISFRASQESEVILKIQDVSGKVLLSKNINAFSGLNQVIVNQNELQGMQGVYFYTLEADAFIATKRMVITK